MCNSCNSCNQCNCGCCGALARALDNLFAVANRCGCNCGCGCGDSARSGFGSCGQQNSCSDAYYARQYALYSVSGNCCYCCCNS